MYEFYTHRFWENLWFQVRIIPGFCTAQHLYLNIFGLTNHYNCTEYSQTCVNGNRSWTVANSQSINELNLIRHAWSLRCYEWCFHGSDWLLNTVFLYFRVHRWGHMIVALFGFPFLYCELWKVMNGSLVGLHYVYCTLGSCIKCHVIFPPIFSSFFVVLIITTP